MVRTALLTLALFVAPRAAPAQERGAPRATTAADPPAGAASALPAAPSLHHVPLTVAAEHRHLVVAAAIERPDLVKRALLVYRHGETTSEVPFERSALQDWPYVAVIPASDVQRPSIEYAIELERTDSQRVAAFASRPQMQPVEVVGDFVDAREEALLARLHGRRFVMEASAEYAYFGKSTADVCATGCPGVLTQPLVSRSFDDAYWRLEAGFTYRLLRTVSEFGIRGGMYRGTSVVPNVSDPSQFHVGLNYGAPWVRVRLADWMHVEGELLSSITEVGFSVGGGGAVLVGDPYGSHLTLGFESVEVFGTRGYSRFDAVSSRLRVAPVVEVTTMPHASNAGVRLLMDIGYDLGGGWVATLRGGYQARSFDSGGPAVGAGAGYSF